MKHIMITYGLDRDRYRELARERGDMLPLCTETSMIDAGPDVVIAFNSTTQELLLRGTQVQARIEAVKHFSVST